MKKHTAKYLTLVAVVCCFMLALCLSGANIIAQVQAAETLKEQELSIVKGQEFEQKIYSKVTIDDNFDDSSVLVIIDKKIGTLSKESQRSFFSNVEMVSAEDLTSFDDDIKTANVQESVKLNIDDKTVVKTDTDDDCRQILKINLTKNSKGNVLDVIGQLEKTEGVKYAGPNYLYTPMATN